MKDKKAVEVVFFDAVGTLIHLPKGVAHHYRLVGQRHDLEMDETALNAAFRCVWKQMPMRATTKSQRQDDDKGWWQELVRRVLVVCGKKTDDKIFEAYFEELYRHFTAPGVWELYPEVIDTLSQLGRSHRLAVISNFDGRLRVILDRLGVSGRFEKIVISSEVGADKPASYIFQYALDSMGVNPADAVHVGDDPVNDWQAGAAAGMRVYRLDRPGNSLADLPDFISGQ